MTEGGGEHRPFVPATLGEAVRQASRWLTAAGIAGAGAGRDARILVAAACDVDATTLVAESERPVASGSVARLAAMLRRRAEREPVSRILGLREFFGRRFIVTPDTLDPRPDSETLIEAALEVIDLEGWRERPIRILDVGVGTGCLLLTLLAELPRATGVGIDISVAALEVAARNAEALGLRARTTLAVARGLEATCDIFDLLVCNPPYIPSREIAGLAPEVRAFDPILALDGGLDGLDVYRQLAPHIAASVPQGWAHFEVGAGQSEDVAALLAAAVPQGRLVGTTPRIWRDLDGRERCVAVRTQR